MATVEEQAEALRALGLLAPEPEPGPVPDGPFVEAIRPAPPLTERIDAERALVASRTTGPQGVALPPGPERDAAEAQIRARMEAIESTPSVPGGDSSFLGSIIGTGPALPRPPARGFFEVAPAETRTAEAAVKSEAAAIQSEGFVDRIRGIIAPQVLGAREDIDFQAARDRIKTTARITAERALRANLDQSLTAEQRSKTLARLLASAEKADPTIRPILVRAASVRTNEDLAGLYDALANPEPGSPLAPSLGQQGMEWLAALLTEEGPDGRLVESDTATLLRGLGTGVSGLAGLAEGIVRTGAQALQGREIKPVDTTLDAMEEAIREGQGFVDVLGRLGNQAGEIVDEITGLGVAKETGQVIGGLGGLAVDFALPIDLFAGKLAGTVAKSVSKARAPALPVLVKGIDDLLEVPDLPLSDLPLPDPASGKALPLDVTDPDDLSRLLIERKALADDVIARRIEEATDPVDRLTAIPESVRNPVIVDTAKAFGLNPDEIAAVIADPASRPDVAAAAYEVKINEIARRAGDGLDPKDIATEITSEILNNAMAKRGSIPLAPGPMAPSIPLATGWVRVSDQVRVPRHRLTDHAKATDELLTRTGVRDALAPRNAGGSGEAVPRKVFDDLEAEGVFIPDGLREILDRTPRGEPIPKTRLTPAVRREIMDSVSTHVARKEIPGTLALPQGQRLPRARAEVVFQPAVFDQELRSSRIADATARLMGRQAQPQGLLNELATSVRNQLGSSSEVFRARWREARAKGLGPEEAVEEAVLAEFLPEGGLAAFAKSYTAGVFGGLERGFEEVRAASGTRIGAAPRGAGRPSEVGLVNRGVRFLIDNDYLDLDLGGEGVRGIVDWVHSAPSLRALIKPDRLDEARKALRESLDLSPAQVDTLLSAKPLYSPGPVPLAAVYNQARAARIITEAGRRFRQAIPDQILGGQDLVGRVANDLMIQRGLRESPTGFVEFTFPTTKESARLEKEAREIIEAIPDWLAGRDEALPPTVPPTVMADAARAMAKYVPDREVAAALIARANDLPVASPSEAATELSRALARAPAGPEGAAGGLEALLAQPAIGEGRAVLDVIQRALRTADVTEDLRPAVDRAAPSPVGGPIRAYLEGLRPTKVLDTVDRVAKGGLLGGWIAPNLPYHVANFVSAPAIILQTLGTKEALAALGELMKRPLTAAMDIVRPFRAGGLDEVVVPKGGPTGQAYTRRDILRLMADNGVTRSQAAAESAAGLASEIQRLGRAGLFGPITRDFDPTQLTLWNQIANDTDLYWRAGILRRALAEGASEADALQRARTGLLDYHLSDIERRYIARLVWFWSFQSRMINATVKNIVDPGGPARLERASRLVGHDISGLLEAAGVEGAAWDGQGRVMPPEYMDNRRLFNVLINDPEARQRWGLYGPAMPMPDALMMIVDLGAGLVQFAKDLGGATGKSNLEIQREIQGDVATLIAGRGSIASKGLGLLLGFEAPAFGIGPGGVTDRSARPSPYVDPRYAAALKASGLWEAFTALVPVDLVQDPNNPEGRGYRVRKGGEQTWAWLRLASLASGLDRSARLYGPLLTDAPAGGGPARLRSEREALLYALGIATPATVVSEEAAESSRAWDDLYKIKAASGK